MKLLLSSILILTMFTSSCSTYFSPNPADRTIASTVTAPMGVDELFTIKSTNLTGPEILMVSSTSGPYSGIKINYIEDATLDSSIAYKIVPTIEDQRYTVKVFYSSHAKIDQAADVEVKFFLNRFTSGDIFASPFSIFETYYNAKAEDFLSLQALAKIRRSAFIKPAGNLNDYYDQHAEDLAYWTSVTDKFEKQERLYNKQVKPQEEARKAVMDALDKATDDKQFRALVAKNDRKGVAKLLKQYLPWELMAPFEKQFWENHLLVLADPLPIDQRVLIYRGIDDDLIQIAEDTGKHLSKEEAIKEQKIFLMSMMMTKNQGTWNRRLRSLTAMNEKFIGSVGVDPNFNSEFTKSARITTMFQRHSKKPQGSPFLSYTPSLSVAQGFGMKRNTAYFLDPRLIYFNYASGYTGEIEYLLPLISFPDDLAAVYDSSLFPNVPNYQVGPLFDQLATAKLEKELGVGKGEEALKHIKERSLKFFAPAVLRTQYSADPSMKIEQKSLDLLKAMHGMPAKDAAKAIEENGGLVCSDLMKVFWK